MEVDNEQIVNDEQPDYIIHTYKRSKASIEKHRILNRQKMICEVCKTEVSRGNISTHNKSEKHRNLVLYNEIETLTNDKNINTYKQIRDALVEILVKAKATKSND